MGVGSDKRRCKAVYALRGKPIALCGLANCCEMTNFRMLVLRHYAEMPQVIDALDKQRIARKLTTGNGRQGLGKASLVAITASRGQILASVTVLPAVGAGVGVGDRSLGYIPPPEPRLQHDRK
jgi:hypothetical protein